MGARKSSGKNTDPGREILRKFIEEAPKTEIHLHSEAVVSFDSYQKLNVKNSINPELKSPSDYKIYLEMNSLADFIRNFTYLQGFFREAEDFCYMVRDLEVYARRNNIRYLETYFAPSVPKRNGLKVADLLEVFDREMEEAEARGLPIRLIVDMSRTFGLENAQDNLEQLLAYLDRRQGKTRILGVGLGGQESGNDAQTYGPVFTRARERGLKLVAHAGEEVGPESIWSALKDLHAQRIGHGTSAAEDEKLMDYLRDQGIPLEICPTSNVVTGKYVKELKDHPLKTFLSRGMKVTINTDDPIFFSVELNDEIYRSAVAMDLTPASVRDILMNGVNSTFLDPNAKANLISEIQAVYKKHFPE